MLWKLAISGAALLAAGGGAIAADLPTTKGPPPAPVVAPYNWNGFYIGANVGGGWESDGASITNNDPGWFGAAFAAGATPNHYSLSPSGLLGGVQAGYNWQVSPSFVAGLEADI